MSLFRRRPRFHAVPVVPPLEVRLHLFAESLRALARAVDNGAAIVVAWKHDVSKAVHEHGGVMGAEPANDKDRPS